MSEKLSGQMATKLYFSAQDISSKEYLIVLQNKKQCLNLQLEVKDTDIKNLKHVVYERAYSLIKLGESVRQATTAISAFQIK